MAARLSMSMVNLLVALLRRVVRPLARLPLPPLLVVLVHPRLLARLLHLPELPRRPARPLLLPLCLLVLLAVLVDLVRALLLAPALPLAPDRLPAPLHPLPVRRPRRATRAAVIALRLRVVPAMPFNAGLLSRRGNSGAP